MDNRTLTQRLRDPEWVRDWYAQAGSDAADRIEELEAALFEAHALLCFNYQSMMRLPSQTDGRYEESMRVWNLEPAARDLMTAPEQCLYDALMKIRHT